MVGDSMPAGGRWLRRDDKSMGEVSTMLGHSSIQTTEKSLIVWTVLEPFSQVSED